ncbi:MAG: ABC transporter permease [Chloroflexi bacterium]|nr:ABC transporter permease [Chloroflexota bacterium]
MLALLVANLKMMVRDRQTLFWALVFPLIFVVVFGLFDVDRPSSSNMAVIDEANNQLSLSIREQLTQVELLNIDTSYASLEEAQEALRDGDLDYLLVIPQSLTAVRPGTVAAEPALLALYYDAANVARNQLVFGVVSQFLNELNLKLVGATPRLVMTTLGVQARQVKYFDVLLVGLVGMGVMFNSIIALAVKMSLYRDQRILKRILVTPIPVRSYFASEVLAHLLLSLVQAVIILAAGVFLFGARIYGNVLWIFLIVAFANIIFLNIGFLVGGWAKNPATASGIGNVVAMPMMFFSGTFFPTSSLPAFMPELVRVLPLTPMLDTMRHVALQNQPLWQQWPDLAMLAGWVAISSLAAVKLFRFG